MSAILGFFLGKRRVGFADQFRSRLYTETVAFSKKQHMVENYLDMIRKLGIAYDTDRLERLEVEDSAKKKVDRYLKESGIRKDSLLIGITPGVAETVKSRMWYEKRFAMLSDVIIEKLNAKVIFIDSQTNAETVDKILMLMKEKPINAAGRFNLYETFHLIGRCKIFISNDTGPMHIAAAQGCKTIGLFGPNTPVLWAPFGKGNVPIYKTKLPPSIQNDKGIFEDRDRDKYMGPITVDAVFLEVKRLMKKI